MKNRNLNQVFTYLFTLAFVWFLAAGCESMGGSTKKNNKKSNSISTAASSAQAGISDIGTGDETAATLDALPLPAQKECAPGADGDQCHNADGGTPSHKFWVKDRSPKAPEGISAFYQINANQIAVTKHFVFYLENQSLHVITAKDAGTMLDTLETGYTKLVSVYGNGHIPDVQKTGRIVILAFDIKDGYSKDSNPNFIGGFFAQRDLYSDEFTSSLYDQPENLEGGKFGNFSLIETAQNLRGRSNENQILYMDINPYYNGLAKGGDADAKALSKKLFQETLFHEVSHLLTYHSRVIIEGKRNHVSGIAEGLAEQAPIILANLTETQKDRLSQYSLPSVQNFLANNTPSLLEIAENPLAGYLQTNLFFNYIRHRLGKEDRVTAMFQTIVKAADETIIGLADSLAQGKDDSLAFAPLFADWVLTNYLSGSGKNLSKLISADGGDMPLGDDSAPSRKHDLSYAGVHIGKKGNPEMAFQENSLPFGSTETTCLPAASYLYLNYTSSGVPITYVPVEQGMDDALKLILITLPNETDVEASFYNADGHLVLNTQSILNEYHLIVYNPLTTGGCLAVGKLPSTIQALVSWIGGGKRGWQTAPGAAWDNNDSFFYRTTGTALSLKKITGSDKNYIYVADSVNQSVSRWNLDTGAFEGRMGSKNSDCSAESVKQDGWKTNEGKLVSSHCLRNFNAPAKIAVDSQGYLYITDQGNHRIVKRDKDGNFVAWLGSPQDDKWQTESPRSLQEMAGYETHTKMFNGPTGIVIDEANDYFYIVCSGSSRVVRRVLSTGAYAGFIGNGLDGWKMTKESYLGIRHETLPKYFKYPHGITLDDEYLYIADEGNHRIVRWTKTGFLAAASGETDKVYMGGGREGWHAQAATSGEMKLNYFNSPADVAVFGDTLYIADRRNQRIVQWDKTKGIFQGWIGGGTLQWEKNVEGPALEPVGPANVYPSMYMLEPLSLSIGAASDKDTANTYLYTTSVFNGRVTRWNLDCLSSNVIQNCGE